ncbi:MAG: hypothetical protein IVW55_05185 [Chloroflexi bacterium]|nr:hypothetical protein [Chloroflexota bacterium]
MKRILLTTLFSLSLAMVGFQAAASGVALADGVKGVAVQPLTPKAGDVITVKGDLLGPNSTVEVRVVGTGVDIDLGEVDADANGDFSAQFRLPEDLKPGTYQVTAKGAESATTAITVVGVGGDAASEGAMGGEPVLKQRPLGESLLLVGVFGVISALGIFLARTARDKPSKV